MNAPTRAIELLEARVELLPLTAIAPSETHIQALRRQRFTKDELQDLADSITKTRGVLQPIVVRPLAALRGLAKYEIVAGERRWLASKLANFAHIHASVREISDQEVLEVQLIENLQRKGLHELEEAEGYDELMKLKKISAEQLVDMVGKSRSYVYARLKLLALCPEARKAFYAGELDASRALLIARIAHHDTQRSALKDITQGESGWGGRRDGKPMSYREAHQHILQNYMLQLAKAPFDIKDATLVPKAGDCFKCPKRTGNQADLFGDVKSADVCTDPKCFDEKRIATFSKAAKALEAKGKKVIYGEDAKKIFPHWDENNAHSRDRMSDRYAPMNGEIYVSGRGHVSPRDVLGEDFEPTYVQHPGTGDIVQVASQQAVAAAVGKRRTAAAIRGSGPKKAKGPDVDEVLTDRLAALIAQRAPKEFNRTWHVELARQFRQNLSNRDLAAVARAWGWKASAFNAGGYSRTLPAEAAKLGERDLVLLMFHMVFAIGPYTRKPVLKLFGIDEQEIREQILEERKQAQRAAREKAKAEKEAKAAKSAKPRPVDQVNAAIDKRAAKSKAKKPGKPKASAKKKGKKK